MMRFRQIRDDLSDLLTGAAAGRWRVLSTRARHIAAEDLLSTNWLLQVIFSEGEFPKSGGSSWGEQRHDLKIRIDLTVAAPAVADVAVISDEESTPAELTAALVAMVASSATADEELDAFIDAVWVVLTDPRNIDLGDDYNVGSKWISGVRKHEPVRRGELVIAAASFDLTCSVVEELTGETPVEAVSIDVTLNVGDLETQKQGTREQLAPEPEEVTP